jgi:hypothetical protein
MITIAEIACFKKAGLWVIFILLTGGNLTHGRKRSIAVSVIITYGCGNRESYLMVEVPGGLIVVL